MKDALVAAFIQSTSGSHPTPMLRNKISRIDARSMLQTISFPAAIAAATVATARRKAWLNLMNW
jgi:hypothetical protein